MGLDFKRAADLFLGSQQELARALRIAPEELSRYRREPDRAPESVLLTLADVLAERGRAMVRVSEMLREDATGTAGNGRGSG